MLPLPIRDPPPPPTDIRARKGGGHPNYQPTIRLAGDPLVTLIRHPSAW